MYKKDHAHSLIADATVDGLFHIVDWRRYDPKMGWPHFMWHSQQVQCFDAAVSS